jgi:hypothetical protein
MTTKDITTLSVPSLFYLDTTVDNRCRLYPRPLSTTNNDPSAINNFLRSFGGTTTSWTALTTNLDAVLRAGNTSQLPFYINNAVVASTSQASVTASKISCPTLTTEGSSTQVNNISISAGAIGATPTITTIGAATDISLNVSPKGNGTISILNSANFGFQVSSSLTTQVEITSVGSPTNLSLNIIPRGTGFMNVGLSANSYLQIPGIFSNTLYLKSLSGASTDTDILFRPRGNGNFYPLGLTPNTGPKKMYFATTAGSTSLGSGVSGEVLTSNATSGSPYWTTFSGNNKTPQYNYVSVATFTGSYGTNTYAANMVSQLNNLGLTFNAGGAAGTITGFVNGGLYRVEIFFQGQLVLNASWIGFFSVTTTNNITTSPTIENGAAVNIFCEQKAFNLDWFSNYVIGYYSAPLTGTPTLYSYLYTFFYSFLQPGLLAPVRVTVIFTRLR